MPDACGQKYKFSRLLVCHTTGDARGIKSALTGLANAYVAVTHQCHGELYPMSNAVSMPTSGALQGEGSAASLTSPFAPQHPPNNSVTLGLRLGWLLGEILGLVRREALTHLDQSIQVLEPPTPRLWISDRPFRSRSRLMLVDLYLLRGIAEELGLWPAPEQVDNDPFAAWVNQTITLLQQPKRSSDSQEVAVFQQLETWSLGIHGRLHARSELIGRALIYGASLADTYWHMLYPPKANAQDQRRNAEKWQSLLHVQRLAEESKRIGELAPYLDEHVAVALQASLKKWGVSEKLKQQGDAFNVEQERRVMGNLRQQSRIWRDLVLGTRLPAGYLRPLDRWLARLGQYVLSTLLSLVVTAVVALLAWGLVYLLGQILFPALWKVVIDLAPNQQPTLELKDILGVITVLATLLGTAWRLTAWTAGQLGDAHRWLGQFLFATFIKRRTYRAWDYRGN